MGSLKNMALTYFIRRVYNFQYTYNNYFNNRTIFVVVILFSTISNFTFSQTQDSLSSKVLKKLSLEELMNIEVTSVSMRPEKLTEVASAIQVITSEDIQRSGVTKLPEALRLTPNIMISQGNSHDWSITSRGFGGTSLANGILSNKILALIDGRAIYTPLFGGVFWDMQNILMEDISRIEVVSGPGGTLWGANAVNGVINVTTKSAKETQGVYASAGGGTFLQDFGEVRYGFHLNPTTFCRVYAQHFDQKSTTLTKNGSDSKDAWNMTQGGFRMDYYLSRKNTLTFQGDFYGNIENNFDARNERNGQNILAHFTHAFSDKSDINIKMYFDHTGVFTPFSKKYYYLKTYDFDFQHHFSLGKWQNILWGANSRLNQDNTNTSFVPTNRNLLLLSGFVQDEITIVPKQIKFTVGSKLLHNDYSGYEFQPSARIAWTPGIHHTIWAAVSRAVRTPSRLDEDVLIAPNHKFTSEKVTSYELGYRIWPINKLLLSFATFYNHYDDLRSLDTNIASSSPTTLVFANSQQAESWGFEFSGNYKIINWWRLRGGYSYFKKHIWATSNIVSSLSTEFEGIEPENQFLIQSIMDLPKNIKLDLVGRYVDDLPPGRISGHVPSYFTFDVHIAWRFNIYEISIAGQNLLEDYHTEVGTTKIPRSVYGKFTVRF